MRPMCKHCGREPVTRPRGLGHRCYYTPGIRDRYGWTDDRTAGSRGVALTNAEPPPPAEPTAALQGTEEKIAVLAARAAAGVGLFHPRDGQQHGEG